MASNKSNKSKKAKTMKTAAKKAMGGGKIAKKTAPSGAGKQGKSATGKQSAVGKKNANGAQKVGAKSGAAKSGGRLTAAVKGASSKASKASAGANVKKKSVVAKSLSKSASKSPSKSTAANKGAASKASTPLAKKKSSSLSLASSTRNRVSTLKDFFTPLDDRILVEPAEASNKTAGGIYIPDTVQERPNRGQVVAVGRGHRNKKGSLRPLDVQLGDAVLYGQHAGVSLALEGRDVILLREEEILAIVNT